MSEDRFSQEFLKHISEIIADRPAAESVRAAAIAIASSYGEVSVDDLRECMDVEGDARFFGAVLSSMAKGAMLEKFGFRKTRRTTSHGRDIARFRLTPDWRLRWPAGQRDPTIRTFIGSDGRTYVEEKSK